jgi:hypothetical protein
MNLASVATIASAAIVTNKVTNETVTNEIVTSTLNVSGASLSGVERTFVWYAAGFASAATTNVMRIIAPFSGRFQYFTAMSRTPVSGASLTLTLFNSGASVFDIGTTPFIIGGGTFYSGASIKAPNFTRGNIIQMDVVNGGSVADILLEGVSY